MKKILKQSEAIDAYYSDYYIDEHQKYFTTKRTAKEVDFLIEHLKRMPDSVCDIGCGDGHHLAQFKKLNINHALGIDSNKNLLSIANEKVNFDPNFKLINIDFRSWNPTEKFDIVYTLFSSICYCLEDYELQDLVNKMVKSVSSTGIVVIDTENILSSIDEFEVEYSVYNRTMRFNPEKMTIDSVDDCGDKKLEISRRYYLAHEIKEFLQNSGIKKENIQVFGDFDNSRYTLSSDRIIVVGRL